MSLGSYFNVAPLAPPGAKVIIHDKTRNTFGSRGCDGWYIGPSPKHYRCYRCINSSSGRPIDADTVKFIPHDTPFPSVTVNDYLHQAAAEILHILQKNHKIPSVTFEHPTTNAFIQLTQILKRSTIPVQYTSLSTVVPNSNPVSSPRVTHNVAPLGTVQHNKMVSLAVPKNNPVSSPRVHQIAVTPLETVHHSKIVQLMTPNNNHVFSSRVYQNVTPLEIMYTIMRG